MTRSRPAPWWRELARLLRDSLRGNEQDYTRGPVRRTVVLLAVPMMLEMSMESLFAIVDIYFVGGLGAGAVAAVGLTEAVLTLVYAIGIGVSMGATALVARRIGEQDLAGARRAAAQTLWLGLAVSVLIAVPGLIYAPDLLRLMGAAPDVVAEGTAYMAIMLGGSATIIFLFLINAVFRGAGDAMIAMRSLWLANGINIVLDPCLIFGWGPFPEMGLTGAAVASTIGRGAGVAWQLWCLTGGRGRISLGLRDLPLVPAVTAALARLSVGGVAQLLIATSSWIVLIRLLAPYGSEAVAGYTIAVRILAFSLLPAWGIANAAATLVGQNLGAGQPDRAAQSVREAAWFNVGLMGFFAAVCVIWAPGIIGTFTPDADVLAYGVDCLRITAAGFVFYGVGMVMTQALNGAGDTDTPTLINLACFWCFQIPLAWALTSGLGLGPRGVFLAVLIAESLLAVVALLVFRRGRWRQRQV